MTNNSVEVVQGELLPCPNPWCHRSDGFPPVLSWTAEAFVECSSCGMQGPSVSPVVYDEDGESVGTRDAEAEAVRLWNTRINSEKALAAEMPTIWEDPAGKGYPCFERPMTPAEAKQTIERWGARIVELESAAQALAERVREACVKVVEGANLAGMRVGEAQIFIVKAIRSLDLYRDA